MIYRRATVYTEKKINFNLQITFRKKLSEFKKGEMINRIEKNIQMSQDYVASAVEQTKQANTFQSKARRVRVLKLKTLMRST